MIATSVVTGRHATAGGPVGDQSLEQPWRGPVACITGASSGIGAALARVYAAKGHALVLVARRKERLESVAQSCLRVPVELVVGDVVDPAVLQQAVDRAREKFGGLDVMVANAGFGVVGQLEALGLEEIRRQLDVNVMGVVHAARAAIPLLRQRQGRLALVGSVNGFLSFPGGSPYAMSKAAVRALADSLWLELRPHGVSVTHVAPGFVDTEIRRVDNSGAFRPEGKDPIPRWAQLDADVAAYKIWRAIHKRRAEIVITALGVLAVFMARHFPRVLRWTLALTGVEARVEPQ